MAVPDLPALVMLSLLPVWLRRLIGEPLRAGEAPAAILDRLLDRWPDQPDRRSTLEQLAADAIACGRAAGIAPIGWSDARYPSALAAIFDPPPVLWVRGAVSALDAHVATRIMSFPLARARAVGGKLTTGDRVDVLAVDHDSGHAGYVVTDAEVVAVDGRSGGALSGASDDVTITLVVDQATAPELAVAIDAGTVMLVRSTGAPAVHGPTPFAPRSTK